MSPPTGAVLWRRRPDRDGPRPLTSTRNTAQPFRVISGRDEQQRRGVGADPVDGEQAGSAGGHQRGDELVAVDQGGGQRGGERTATQITPAGTGSQQQPRPCQAQSPDQSPPPTIGQRNSATSAAMRWTGGALNLPLHFISRPRIRGHRCLSLTGNPADDSIALWQAQYWAIARNAGRQRCRRCLMPPGR
jgi:hypothetical protein